jgi:hypothetical protein
LPLGVLCALALLSLASLASRTPILQLDLWLAICGAVACALFQRGLRRAARLLKLVDALRAKQALPMMFTGCSATNPARSMEPRPCVHRIVLILLPVHVLDYEVDYVHAYNYKVVLQYDCIQLYENKRHGEVDSTRRHALEHYWPITF